MAGFAIGAIVLVLIDDATPLGDRLAGATFLLAGGGSAYVGAIRPRVIICDDLVTVHRYFSTVRFPTREVSHAVGGSVLWLHRIGAEPVRIMAVATDNVTLALGRPGRAERVADEINARLGPSALLSAEGFRPTRRVNRWQLLILVGLAIAQIALVVASQAIRDDDGPPGCVERSFTIPSSREHDATEVEACVPQPRP